jgi:hypothetical protein
MSRRLALTAAVVLLTLLAPAAGAHAAVPPANPSWPWPRVCTEAAFTDHSAHRYGDQTRILLSGWIRPCAGETDSGGIRSFTIHHADGANRSPYLSPLRDPYTQSYTFEVSGWRGAPVTAVCIIDYTWPVKGDDRAVWPFHRACVGIDEGDGGLVVTPIPVTDPRVSGRVTARPRGDDTPFCAGCL